MSATPKFASSVPVSRPTNKQLIVDALRAKPGRTVDELTRATGLRQNQVHTSLYSYRRTAFRKADSGLWYLQDQEVPKTTEQCKLPLEDHLVELLRQQQPRTLEELTLLTGKQMRKVFSALGNRTLFEKDGSLYWRARKRGWQDAEDNMLSDVQGLQHRKSAGASSSAT
jgi:hypothetical protein